MNLYEETKFIMKQNNITANKSLGQNFLIDENVVDCIVSSAEITEKDLVIEIGPGLGTLTKLLLDKAGKVICIELDTNMLKILEDRFSLYNNFELINNDVLKVDLKNNEAELVISISTGTSTYVLATGIVMIVLAGVSIILVKKTKE